MGDDGPGGIRLDLAVQGLSGGNGWHRRYKVGGSHKVGTGHKEGISTRDG